MPSAIRLECRVHGANTRVGGGVRLVKRRRFLDDQDYCFGASALCWRCSAFSTVILGRPDRGQGCAIRGCDLSASPEGDGRYVFVCIP